MCVVPNKKNPERGQLCHLRFTVFHSLLPPTPMGLFSPEYENTLSLNKSLPQLQFILVCLLLSLAVADETWT